MWRFDKSGMALAALAVASQMLAQRPSSAVGVWATEGYGLVLDLRADSVFAFEVTKVSCIPQMQARTTAPPQGARQGALKADDPPHQGVVSAMRRDANCRASN